MIFLLFILFLLELFENVKNYDINGSKCTPSRTKLKNLKWLFSRKMYIQSKQPVVKTKSKQFQQRSDKNRK